MKYQLQQNLGLDDARHCNAHFGCQLPTVPAELAVGNTVSLTDAAVNYLTVTKGYTALLEEPGKVKGEAKRPEITAPAK